MKVCKQCRLEVEEDIKFCPRCCGGAFDTKEEPEEEPMEVIEEVVDELNLEEKTKGKKNRIFKKEKTEVKKKEPKKKTKETKKVEDENSVNIEFVDTKKKSQIFSKKEPKKGKEPVKEESVREESVKEESVKEKAEIKSTTNEGLTGSELKLGTLIINYLICTIPLIGWYRMIVIILGNKKIDRNLTNVFRANFVLSIILAVLLNVLKSVFSRFIIG